MLENNWQESKLRTPQAGQFFIGLKYLYLYTFKKDKLK